MLFAFFNALKHHTQYDVVSEQNIANLSPMLQFRQNKIDFFTSCYCFFDDAIMLKTGLATNEVIIPRVPASGDFIPYM